MLAKCHAFGQMTGSRSREDMTSALSRNKTDEEEVEELGNGPDEDSSR